MDPVAFRIEASFSMKRLKERLKQSTRKRKKHSNEASCVEADVHSKASNTISTKTTAEALFFTTPAQTTKPRDNRRLAVVGNKRSDNHSYKNNYRSVGL